MIFIETSIFTRLLPKYLSDDEYRAFQWHLMVYPDAGDVVRGSGGVRKIRWARKGEKGWSQNHLLLEKIGRGNMVANDIFQKRKSNYSRPYLKKDCGGNRK